MAAARLAAARYLAQLLRGVSFFGLGEAGITLRKPLILVPETGFDTGPVSPPKALVGLVSIMFCDVLHGCDLDLERIDRVADKCENSVSIRDLRTATGCGVCIRTGPEA